VGEVLQFKAIKLRSRRSHVGGNGRKAVGAPPQSTSPPAPRTNAASASKGPEETPSVIGFAKQAAIPLIILLCSIAAFSIVMAHLSGQPRYSARSNVSIPALTE
jgi:hypothetical protein